MGANSVGNSVKVQAAVIGGLDDRSLMRCAVYGSRERRRRKHGESEENSSNGIAEELFNFLEGAVRKGSIFALEIFTEGRNWKSRGHGRVQFETSADASQALYLARHGRLQFQHSHLDVSRFRHDQIIRRPLLPENRLSGGYLQVGAMLSDTSVVSFAVFEVLRAEVMPERNRVDFWVRFNDREYRLEIHYGDIVGTFGLCPEEENCSRAVMLKVRYAPRIYQKVCLEERNALKGSYYANMPCKEPAREDSLPKFSSDNRYYLCKEVHDFLWIRTTNFTSSGAFGNCSCFVWDLPDTIDTEAFKQLVSSFPLYEEMIELAVEDGAPPSSMSNLVPIVDLPDGCALSYDIFFQLNSLVHSQKISRTAISSELLKKLVYEDVDNLRMVLRELNKQRTPCYNLESYIADQLIKMSSKRTKEYVCCDSFSVMSCFRILVSPSKVYFLGPELEPSNPVVRHFAKHASDFVRVSFVEEDLGRLSQEVLSPTVGKGWFAKAQKTKVHGRVFSILRDGIIFGRKRFEFLAFSASQLRAGSVWMFASNSEVTAKDVRNWMGEFKGIRSVAKHAARMGQLFSSSLQALNVPQYEIEEIPDIECVTNHITYCFSDGIGKISSSFADKVAKRCGLDHTPSAFQVRYGGYKGVIAVDPYSFKKLSLRPSMRKFSSKDNTMLNITKWSKSMPCFLNREIISLLSSLGVKNEKFMAMLDEQLRDLDEMVRNPNIALNILESLGNTDSMVTLTKMLLQGYKPNEEPYLSLMLNAYHHYQLFDLRRKCRIYVPKGRVLMGCLDETRTLDYGEVFIRVTKSKAELQEDHMNFFRKVDDDDTTFVVLGEVVVTKNPCLHPGDVRVLRATYAPALEEQGLIDCLVFPQKGKRPHPSECSGGDLDGDLFFVSWDVNIIPSSTDAPLHYIGRKRRTMAEEVTLKEVQEFFVNYMINDSLGAIANAHLVHADREPEKTRSAKCRELAVLHSEAVDFAKTGAEAEMPRALVPKEYPDFMERPDKPTYASPGVLGALYRATLEKRVQNDDYGLVWTKEVAQSTYDIDLEVSGFENFIEVAVAHKEQYGSRLHALMDYYGAENEHEILTGNVSSQAPFMQTDKQKLNDTKDRILISVKVLQKEARYWFDSSCSGTDSSQMASAWYHVTYHPDHFTRTTFLSFPWILCDILLSLKSSKKNHSV